MHKKTMQDKRTAIANMKRNMQKDCDEHKDSEQQKNKRDTKQDTIARHLALRTNVQICLTIPKNAHVWVGTYYWIRPESSACDFLLGGNQKKAS